MSEDAVEPAHASEVAGDIEQRTSDAVHVVLATYDTYDGAQNAVDYLTDEGFSVQHLRIVGADLRLIETITGRLSWLRSIAGSAAGGGWLGVLIALVIGLLSPTSADWWRILLTGVAYGALFGGIWGIVSYGVTAGRRDFTSTRSIVAGRYEVTCLQRFADDAGALLKRLR